VNEADLDVIGPWSQIKLELFRDYSDASSTILSNQSAIKRYIDIDGYAGAGTHVSKTRAIAHEVMN
jgi:hypothetical protein